MPKPTVSVVMSVYNGEQFVAGAIKSVLGQTFSDFEFIIIDDGSTDNTKSIITSLKDKRIKLVSRENKGLVASLDEGILQAQGELIARHDADDLSEPTRIEQQVAFMKQYPSIVLLGTSMKVMNESGIILHNHHVLLGNTELKQELLIRSPFAHGSVMFRKNAAIDCGLYRKDFWPAEDYDLWLRLSTKGDFANINEPLYIYRENSDGISSNNQSIQIQQSDRVRNAAWKNRNNLIPQKSQLIDAGQYKNLDDGELRIKRIDENISKTINKAMSRLDLKNTFLLYNLRKQLRLSR